jgi:hypothetical protein
MVASMCVCVNVCDCATYVPHHDLLTTVCSVVAINIGINCCTHIHLHEWMYTTCTEKHYYVYAYSKLIQHSFLVAFKPLSGTYRRLYVGTAPYQLW